MKNKSAVHLGRLAAKKNLAKGREYFVNLGKQSAKARKEAREATLSTGGTGHDRSLDV